MAGSRDSQFSTKADAGENTQIGKVSFQAPPLKAAPARIGRPMTLPIPAIRTTTSALEYNAFRIAFWEWLQARSPK